MQHSDIVDIHNCNVGRYSAKLAMEMNCIGLRFKLRQLSVCFSDVAFICKLAENRLLVQTKSAMKIVPGTTKPRISVLLTCHVPYVMDNLPDTVQVFDCSSCEISSVCGRYSLYAGGGKVVVIFESSIDCFSTEDVLGFDLGLGI